MKLDLDALERAARNLIDIAKIPDGQKLAAKEHALETNLAVMNAPTVLALVARAREADRLEEENDQLVEQRAELRSTIERSAGNAVYWQREKQTILDREKNFSDRATAAEAETTRLRAVVEKLRVGLEQIAYKGNFAATANAARLLAETAPDVPADHDGSAT